MPVRKCEGGWCWGKQGPFKTRAEALKVERAAYANGYKGKRKTPKRSKQKVSLGSRG